MIQKYDYFTFGKMKKPAFLVILHVESNYTHTRSH